MRELAQPREKSEWLEFIAQRDFDDLRVVVVDDVTTTGSTLEACAAALRKAGVAEVRELTFAREV